MKTITVVLTLALLAQAQKSPACNKDITGTGQGDLDAIRGCTEYHGTILVENSPVEYLSLDGVEKIDGNLIIKSSSNLRGFSAPKLKSVKGQLHIAEHTGMEKLELPALTEVSSLTLSVLPVLETIQFPAGLTKVDDLVLQDTRASGIAGLQMDSLHSFTLTQNNYMKQFELPVKQMTGSLFVTGNGHELDFEATQLTSVQNATFRDLAKLNLPQLSHVASDMSFHQNGFSSLHLDGLQDIGGTLAIANNDKLTEVSFKELSLIGGALSIGNNTQLAAIEGFPKLTAVHGTVDLAGAFDKFDIPDLQDIRGGMRIQTTSSRFPCMDLEKKLKMTSVVKGSIWGCKSNMDASKMDPTIGQEAGGNGGSKSNGGAGSSSSTTGGDGHKKTSEGGADEAESSSAAAVVMKHQGSWIALVICSFVFTLALQ